MDFLGLETGVDPIRDLAGLYLGEEVPEATGLGATDPEIEDPAPNLIAELLPTVFLGVVEAVVEDLALEGTEVEALETF